MAERSSDPTSQLFLAARLERDLYHRFTTQTEEVFATLPDGVARDTIGDILRNLRNLEAAAQSDMQAVSELFDDGGDEQPDDHPAPESIRDAC